MKRFPNGPIEPTVVGMAPIRSPSCWWACTGTAAGTSEHRPAGARGRPGAAGRDLRPPAVVRRGAGPRGRRPGAGPARRPARRRAPAGHDRLHPHPHPRRRWRSPPRPRARTCCWRSRPRPRSRASTGCCDGSRARGAPARSGFQSLGSHALPRVRALMADGRDRPGRRASARPGAWQRDAAYYARAPWAGAARSAASRSSTARSPTPSPTPPPPRWPSTAWTAGGPRDVRVELFRANPIEADDTSCLRLVTARGTTVTVAVTLCADREVEPYVVVHGTRGRIVLALPHRPGPARAAADPAVITEHAGTDLLENLVAHVRAPARPAGRPARGHPRLHAGRGGRPPRRRAGRGAAALPRDRRVGPAPAPASCPGSRRRSSAPPSELGAAVRARPAVGAPGRWRLTGG